jgi:hypothetical protein
MTSYNLIDLEYKYSEIMKNIIDKEMKDKYDTKKKINYHKVYYTILGEYLRSINLKRFGDLEYITKYTAILDQCIIKFNVYSINIQIEADKYILYCALYRAWNKDKYLGEFNTTINIVPFENKILPTGQNSTVISMGNYICKVISYKTHSDINSNSNSEQSCSIKYEDIDIDGEDGEYIFTGHCSHNVFPLNEIKFPDWQDINLVEQESNLYFPPKY